MKIAICGSVKFMDQIEKIEEKLKSLGHMVLMPTKLKEVDYWSEDGSSRVEAKKKFDFIRSYMKDIEGVDAVLVVNIDKENIKNYVGANTFLEIGFAYYKQKKIFFLNPIPDQPYIIDEIQIFEPIVINNDLSKIK